MDDGNEAWIQEPWIWLPRHVTTLLGGGAVVNEVARGDGVVNEVTRGAGVVNEVARGAGVEGFGVIETAEEALVIDMDFGVIETGMIETAKEEIVREGPVDVGPFDELEVEDGPDFELVPRAQDPCPLSNSSTSRFLLRVTSQENENVYSQVNALLTK